MRRALLKQLPALTRFYGLKPAEINGMTSRELNEYAAWMNEYLTAE